MTEQKTHRVGLVSLGVGLAAAGVGAAIGLAAERTAIRRVLVREPEADDYGLVRGRPLTVHTDDGAALHVEIDDPDPAPETGRRDRGHPPVTLVFSHGYALSQDSWHFQRKALRGRFRMVFWDQRGHGRSGMGPAGSVTIDRIGEDLRTVLEAVAAEGPLVLVGHSMGGMTVMALADRHPGLFRERVLGVAFVSTSAGGLDGVDLGLPRLGRVIQRLAPGTVRALTHASGLVERGRRIGSDLESVVVRRYSYASPVPPGLVAFTADMIAATRLEVLSEFLPAFARHDKHEALDGLDGIEVLVIVGDSDLLTPAGHSERIVRRLPGAEFVVVRRGGHLLMLEHPDVVTGHLVELVERSLRANEAVATRHPWLVRRTVTPLRRHRRRWDGVT